MLKFRLLKDLESYQKAITDQERKIKDMTDANVDEYDIRKQAWLDAWMLGC